MNRVCTEIVIEMIFDTYYLPLTVQSCRLRISRKRTATKQAPTRDLSMDSRPIRVRVSMVATFGGDLNKGVVGADLCGSGVAFVDVCSIRETDGLCIKISMLKESRV